MPGVMEAFDFDAWAALAKRDPEAFERHRREEIEKLIASAPDRRRRLEGIQFRLDQERLLAHTPLKACLRFSGMMWDSFLDLKRQIDGLQQAATVPRPQSIASAQASSAAPASARVLPFVRPPASGTETA